MIRTKATGLRVESHISSGIELFNNAFETLKLSRSSTKRNSFSFKPQTHSVPR
ncbi:hypothetical protein Bca4012_088389 [Brassica carinata]|uniref:Uncharacterized protein n=1 Tax=Brassica oleracea var. oleracea TaxID=109376 RepID=A0A0D3A737_BRAOL